MMTSVTTKGPSCKTVTDQDHSVQDHYQAYSYKNKLKHCSMLKTVSLTSYHTADQVDG